VVGILPPQVISIFLSLLKGRPVVGDMVSPQIPLVLHLLLADLAGELPAHRVHVEDVLLQVELVAEHPLAVLAHPRLSALPRGSQQGRHLLWPEERGHLVGGRDSVHVEKVQRRGR